MVSKIHSSTSLKVECVKKFQRTMYISKTGCPTLLSFSTNCTFNVNITRLDSKCNSGLQTLMKQDAGLLRKNDTPSPLPIYIIKFSVHNTAVYGKEEGCMIHIRGAQRTFET